MPTDTSLPTSVHVYLELINRLLEMTDGYDSASAEAKCLILQIEKYLAKIEHDMSVYIEENKL